MTELTKHEVDGHAVTLIGYTTFGTPARSGRYKHRQSMVRRERAEAEADLAKRKLAELLAVVVDCNGFAFLAKADLSHAVRDDSGYVVGIDPIASGRPF